MCFADKTATDYNQWLLWLPMRKGSECIFVFVKCNDYSVWIRPTTTTIGQNQLQSTLKSTSTSSPEQYNKMIISKLSFSSSVVPLLSWIAVLSIYRENSCLACISLHSPPAQAAFDHSLSLPSLGYFLWLHVKPVVHPHVPFNALCCWYWMSYNIILQNRIMTTSSTSYRLLRSSYYYYYSPGLWRISDPTPGDQASAGTVSGHWADGHGGDRSRPRSQCWWRRRSSCGWWLDWWSAWRRVWTLSPWCGGCWGDWPRIQPQPALIHRFPLRGRILLCGTFIIIIILFTVFVVVVSFIDWSATHHIYYYYYCFFRFFHSFTGARINTFLNYARHRSW